MIKAPLQCGKVVPKQNRKMCFMANQPPPPQCTFLRNEGLIKPYQGKPMDFHKAGPFREG